MKKIKGCLTTTLYSQYKNIMNSRGTATETTCIVWLPQAGIYCYFSEQDVK